MVMTLEADYAVRIVEYLTKHPGRWDAKTISEQMQVPMRFCLKILRGLVGSPTRLGWRKESLAGHVGAMESICQHQ